jgi:hypothetical protein
MHSSGYDDVTYQCEACKQTMIQQIRRRQMDADVSSPRKEKCVHTWVVIERVGSMLSSEYDDVMYQCEACKQTMIQQVRRRQVEADVF